MKKLIAIAAFATLGFSANAQTSTNQTSTATQTTKLALSNAISITFVDGGKEGADVIMPFQTVSDFANGVTSNEQEMLVQSNKNFNVSMKTDALNFAYAGTTSPAPQVQISNVLSMMVTENKTGGSLSYNNYAPIPNGSATIINWGTPGGNRTFKVKYKANPGFALPAGTYTANVIYTATQP